MVAAAVMLTHDEFRLCLIETARGQQCALRSCAIEATRRNARHDDTLYSYSVDAITRAKYSLKTI